MISATEPDWTREQVRGVRDPSRKTLRYLQSKRAARARTTSPEAGLMHVAKTTFANHTTQERALMEGSDARQLTAFENP